MAFLGTLYPFQKEAVDRMVERKKLLLALDMGLGKTVVSIAAVERLFEEGTIATGGLVVCTASLQYQWKRQIENFTNIDPELVQVVTGSADKRQRLYRQAFGGTFDYLILTYDQVWRDWEYVQRLPRSFIICDEATAIKSFRAKRSKMVKKLNAPYKFALTGQPIENRAEEVFSIMQWVDEAVLGKWDVFDKAFISRDPWGRVRYYRNLPVLHERLNTAMSRRSADDPEIQAQLPRVMPPEDILVEFDTAGANLYRFIVEDLLEELGQVRGQSFDLWAHYNGADGGDLAVRARIMSRMTCLRMLCDHPDLLIHSADMFDGTQTISTSQKGGSMYASDLKAQGLLKKLGAAPKFGVTVETIEEILEANDKNKVVLFSFFKETLGLLQMELNFKTIGSVQFTGDLSPAQREVAMKKFQTEPTCRVFLSSDAGGLGVDLPAGNFIINYDLPWSAGKLDQRNARIRRLSSEWDRIVIINMLMWGSIEERQAQMLAQKRSIGAAVVDGKGWSAKGTLKMDLDTLGSFLTNSSV